MARDLNVLQSQFYFIIRKNEFLELIFKNGYLATCMQEEFGKGKLDHKVPFLKQNPTCPQYSKIKE
ncbi:hypothetical protein LguiB_031962 [Lonicera macranthoides]